MQKPRRKITEKDIERACRMYRTNRDACLALGIRSLRLRVLAKEYGIELPSDRQRRQKTYR